MNRFDDNRREDIATLFNLADAECLNDLQRKQDRVLGAVVNNPVVFSKDLAKYTTAPAGSFARIRAAMLTLHARREYGDPTCQNWHVSTWVRDLAAPACARVHDVRVNACSPHQRVTPATPSPRWQSKWFKATIEGDTRETECHLLLCIPAVSGQRVGDCWVDTRDLSMTTAGNPAGWEVWLTRKADETAEQGAVVVYGANTEGVPRAVLFPDGSALWCGSIGAGRVRGLLEAWEQVGTLHLTDTLGAACKRCLFCSEDGSCGHACPPGIASFRRDVVGIEAAAAPAPAPAPAPAAARVFGKCLGAAEAIPIPQAVVDASSILRDMVESVGEAGEAALQLTAPTLASLARHLEQRRSLPLWEVPDDLPDVLNAMDYLGMDDELCDLCERVARLVSRRAGTELKARRDEEQRAAAEVQALETQVARLDEERREAEHALEAARRLAAGRAAVA